MEEDGLEHLRLSRTNTEIVAESVVLRIQENKPFQLNYRILCDEKWRVREISLDLISEEKNRIAMYSDGEGNWSNENRETLPVFANCFDVDISATPFTNTLPIRRAKLEIGESIDISVVYFLIPEMTIQRSLQNYKRLSKNYFRFEENGLFNGFSENLRVDGNGLVIDYPKLFKRLKK